MRREGNSWDTWKDLTRGRYEENGWTICGAEEDLDRHGGDTSERSRGRGTGEIQRRPCERKTEISVEVMD